MSAQVSREATPIQSTEVMKASQCVASVFVDEGEIILCEMIYVVASNT